MGEWAGTVGSGESKTEALLDRVLEQEGRPALVGYLPLGFPDLERSVEAMMVLADAGVDIIELGIPHTEPVMDGEKIQEAVTIALEQGTRTGHLFEAVRRLREHAPHVEVLVMTYWDPIARYGIDRFAHDLAEAGGAGLITPDLPLDQADEWVAASDEHGLDRVFLVKPSSQPETLTAAAQLSRGFVYAASVVGVTGTRDTIGEQAEELVKNTRAAGSSHVCVGLGVSSGDQAAEVGRWADGVIIGSALVRTMLTDEPWQDQMKNLADVAQDLADGVRRARPRPDPITTDPSHRSTHTPTRGRKMASTMSLPGFDEQLYDALDDKIRAGGEETPISNAEAELYRWLVHENPGRYETFDQVIGLVRDAMPRD